MGEIREVITVGVGIVVWVTVGIGVGVMVIVGVLVGKTGDSVGGTDWARTGWVGVPVGVGS